MKFAQIATPPTTTVVLKPEAWSSGYAKRPSGEVALGLRLLSERELLTAHAEATKEAEGRPQPDRTNRFENALVCWALAYALCDPNDARKPYFARGDEEVRDAFPPETLRHLWHELERLKIELSPVRPLLSAEEAEELAQHLTQKLPTNPRVLRLLRFCLDEITADHG